MYRTHTCGELRLTDVGKTVTLAGWVQRTRDLGGMTFVDLRDRYGITQLTFNTDSDAALRDTARSLGREYVVQVTGTVMERQSKNANMPTGEVEIFATELKVMNSAKTPPFTIEEETDGGDELRMKYRYLDLRRASVRKNFELRHRMAIEVRNYLSAQQFLEVETPVSDQEHAGRRPRFRGAQPHEPRRVLRPAAKPADLQATADGGRHGPLFPDREMLP